MNENHPKPENTVRDGGRCLGHVIPGEVRLYTHILEEMIADVSARATHRALTAEEIVVLLRAHFRTADLRLETENAKEDLRIRHQWVLDAMSRNGVQMIRHSARHSFDATRTRGGKIVSTGGSGTITVRGPKTGCDDG